MVVVIVEKPTSSGWGADSVEDSLKALREIASRRNDVELYEISPAYRFTRKIRGFFSHIPKKKYPTVGIWVGYVPKDHSYRFIHSILQQKNIELINTTLHHQEAMDLSIWSSLLGDLTPKSEIVSSVEGAVRAANEVGYPVFIKGGKQSLKDKGLGFCRASCDEETIEIASWFYENDPINMYNNGLLVIREFLEFQTSHSNVDTGFPYGREFRIFCLHKDVVGISYYWNQKTEQAYLTKSEKKTILDLAFRVLDKINVPFVTIDVGQLKSGQWVVVEIGDAQFSGICHLDPTDYWEEVLDKAEDSHVTEWDSGSSAGIIWG